MSFGTGADDKAIRAAITAIEGVSAVEVVVAIRKYARRWMVQHMIVGLVAAIAVLVFAVLNAWEAWAVLAFPLAAGVVSTLIVEYIPPLYRFLVPAYVRETHVIDAARALFVERGVHRTTGRTGVLVFVAVRARVVEVVADIAVLDKLGQRRIDDFAGKLKAAIPDGAVAVAKALAAFAPELAAAFPRTANDVNELADAPIAVSPEA
jgi:putative membrane protein